MNTLQKKSAIKKGALASKPAQEQLPQNDILATVPQMEEHYETTPSVIINEIDMDQVLMTEPAQNDLQRMLSMSFYERRKTPSPGIRK